MKVTPVSGRYLKREAGEEFELPDKVARAFIRAGKLREVTAALAAEPVSAPASVPDDEISPRTGLPKRQYRRRDLKAED